VKSSAANFLKNGRVVGTFPMGFDLQWISMGFVRRLNSLLTRSMTLVVRKQTHSSLGNRRYVRQEWRELSPN
jgi:hypothetical protein